MMMLPLCGCCDPSDERDYTFSGSISREVLENYLSRAITMSDMFMSMGEPYLDENIRMLTNTGAKFAGRSVLTWGNESSFASVVTNAAPKVLQVHAADSEMILQAGIFEIVTTEVETISVPSWVFDAFGLTPVSRNFDYESMFFDSGEEIDFYGRGSSVPDMTKLETRLWFFYQAASYIDIGIEALHLGQIQWVSYTDTNYANLEGLITRIREYAAENARRKYVFLDGHVRQGIVRNGKLLLDFHSSPMRMKEVAGSDSLQCILEFGHDNAIYGTSLGGTAPSGWSADSLPYLVEFDHGYAYGYEPGACPKEECIWGYDEMSWFAVLDETARNEFLRYAWNWVRENDSNGYVEMPGMRDVQVTTEVGIDWYFANSSDSMIYGYDQEETIKEIWTDR